MVGRIQAGGFVVEYDRDKNMVITAPPFTQDILRLRSQEDEYFDSDRALHDLLEGLICNSELQWIDPSDTGDLTDCPILGILGQDCREADLPAGRFVQVVCGGDKQGLWVQPVLARWGWMRYAVQSLQRALLEEGKAVLVSQA